MLPNIRRNCSVKGVADNGGTDNPYTQKNRNGGAVEQERQKNGSVYYTHRNDNRNVAYDSGDGNLCERCEDRYERNRKHNAGKRKN